MLPLVLSFYYYVHHKYTLLPGLIRIIVLLSNQRSNLFYLPHSSWQRATSDALKYLRHLHCRNNIPSSSCDIERSLIFTSLKTWQNLQGRWQLPTPFSILAEFTCCVTYQWHHSIHLAQIKSAIVSIFQKRLIEMAFINYLQSVVCELLEDIIGNVEGGILIHILNQYGSHLDRGEIWIYAIGLC